ncbi:hypothetical protein GBAR_LOCUS24754, partial [Geodia barretti]
MSVAADVSDWIATPAPFSGNKCGKNAVLSSDNSIVQRRPYPDVDVGDCVCYTVHPLPPGQVWQTTVLETTTGWRDGLGAAGCTKCRAKGAKGNSHNFETGSILSQSSKRIPPSLSVSMCRECSMALHISCVGCGQGTTRQS